MCESSSHYSPGVTGTGEGQVIGFELKKHIQTFTLCTYKVSDMNTLVDG